MPGLAAAGVSSASIEPFLGRAHIAYFTMEIALRPDIHSYSGGLGILAGDTARSSADLEAGHDRFAHDLVERALPGFVDRTVLQKLAGADRLNMTRLALNLSDYEGGTKPYPTGADMIVED